LKLTRRLFVHGDNVIECDRTVSLLEQALDVRMELVEDSLATSPRLLSTCERFEIQLLPGHQRWGFDIHQVLAASGAPIRENADAVITEVLGSGEQKILFAVEFCGALPAGNNAWQRHGRAFAFGIAGYPYLIFNEIGGLELSASREIKASRYPNPCVPLSLVTFSRDTGTPVLPVYEPAPSSPSEVTRSFRSCFGLEDALGLIRALVLKETSQVWIQRLESKATELVFQLSNNRSRQDGLSAIQLTKSIESEGSRVKYWTEMATPWKRRTVEKVRATGTSQSFMAGLASIGACAI